MDTFTTTTIVNNRIKANIISEKILYGWYIILVCFTYSMLMGGSIFSMKEINDRAIIEIDNTIIINRVDKFWLGVIATK